MTFHDKVWKTRVISGNEDWYFLSKFPGELFKWCLLYDKFYDSSLRKPHLVMRKFGRPQLSKSHIHYKITQTPAVK